jgi:hypothetical protein
VEIEASRQCAGSGREDDGETECGFGEHVFLPIAKNHWRISVSGTSTSRQKLVPAMPITPTSAKDNFLTRHHIYMTSNIVL